MGDGCASTRFSPCLVDGDDTHTMLRRADAQSGWIVVVTSSSEYVRV